MIKKSVYKGIPYQIEISNTHNRLLTQNPPQSRLGGGGEGGGGRWGGVRAENFGFCGQIRAVQPPGNSDTEGELGKLISVRERSPQSSNAKKEIFLTASEP